MVGKASEKAPKLLIKRRMLAGLDVVYVKESNGNILDVNAGHFARDKELIITSSDEIVVLDVPSKSMARNWYSRAESELSMTGRVVKHNKGLRYFGIRGKKRNVIATWAQSEVTNEGRSKTMAGKSIVNIFVDDTLGSIAIVVYTDGVVQIVDFELQEVKIVQERKGTHAISHASLQRINGIVYLYLVQNDTFQVFSLAKGKEESLLSTSLLSHALEGPEGATVQDVVLQGNYWAVSVFWSDGSWQEVQFQRNGPGVWGVTRSQNIAQLFTEKPVTVTSTTTTNADTGNNPRKRRKGGDVPTKPTYTGCALGMESQMMLCDTSITGKLTLCQWEAAFGVELERSVVADYKPEFGKLLHLHPLARGSSILLVLERAVLIASIKTGPSTLASVLGKMKSSVQEAPLVITPQISSTAFESVENGTLNDSAWQSSVYQHNTLETEMLKKLLDRSTNPTGAHLAAQLKLYLNKVIPMADATRKGSSESDLRAACRNAPHLSYQCVMKVTKRCLTECKKLKPWDALEICMHSTRLSARALPELIPTLLKYNQHHLVGLAISLVVDLPENMYATLIRYCFTQMTLKTTSSSKKKQSAYDVALTRNLCHLLARPCNDVLLHRSVRSLSLVEVRTMLSFLMHQFSLQNTLPCHMEYPKLPSMSILLEWISMLLDIHFQALIMASSEPSLVAQLETCKVFVQGHLTACASIADAHGAISHFLTNISSSKSVKTKTVPDYSIECIEF